MRSRSLEWEEQRDELDGEDPSVPWPDDEDLRRVGNEGNEEKDGVDNQSPNPRMHWRQTSSLPHHVTLRHVRPLHLPYSELLGRHCYSYVHSSLNITTNPLTPL